MAFCPDLKRYEKYGRDYQVVNALTDAEVAWYEMWANDNLARTANFALLCFADNDQAQAIPFGK